MIHILQSLCCVALAARISNVSSAQGAASRNYCALEQSLFTKYQEASTHISCKLLLLVEEIHVLYLCSWKIEFLCQFLALVPRYFQTGIPLVSRWIPSYSLPPLHMHMQAHFFFCMLQTENKIYIDVFYK